MILSKRLSRTQLSRITFAPQQYPTAANLLESDLVLSSSTTALSNAVTPGGEPKPPGEK
jgi:hypothetical protein